ncbi:MAG: ArsR/SmtB family transcription factor [Candidatus Thorarchaeota archaeon]|jgi:DNA-binding transcriptional ArsR family regulator
MTREYIERLENLEEYCKTAPEGVSTPAPYYRRREELEIFRDLFLNSSPEVFTAPIRSGIAFLLLTLGEACVCEIQFALDEPRQPLLSHHLSEMKKAEWLESERRGRWTYYRLSKDKKASLIRLFEMTQEE